MVTVTKTICFKFIAFYHTLIIIVMCKTYVKTEPIYRTYCRVCPLSAEFIAFCLSISLFKVGTKSKEEENYEGIRLHELLDVFSILST